MPLFSFLQRNNSASREPVGMASPGEQVQAARVRARRRLIGAVVLLGVGIVGFPLLFETQPRPLPVEVNIEIPRKDGGAPVVLPSRMAPATSSTITESAADAGREVPPPAAHAVAPVPTRPAVPASTPAVRPAAPAVAADTRAPATQSLAASTPRPVASAPAAPIRVLQDPPRPAPPKETPPARDLAKEREAAAAREAAAREAREREAREVARQKELAAREAKEKEAAAREREAAAREAKEKEAAAREAREKAAAREAAAREAKEREAREAREAVAREALRDTSRSDTVEKRYIVQVGAFADAAAASEARARAEKVGVRTYTQVIETDAGRRIRVRVGPFNSREEADKALGKLRAAGLSTALLPQ